MFQRVRLPEQGVWDSGLDEGEMAQHPEWMVPAACSGLGERVVLHIFDQLHRGAIGNCQRQRIRSIAFMLILLRM